MENDKKIRDLVKTTLREVLNENKDIEPYYNEDFKDKLKKLLIELGYEDIEFEVDGVSFHNPYGDDVLVNKKSSVIYDFIENYGYDPDDFIIGNFRIFYPTNF